MGNNGRRRGGAIGVVVLVGYLVLRFGFLAYREHEEGMSTEGIVLSLLGFASLAFVIVELVNLGYHAHTRRREQALAARHPGAHLVPVLLSRDLGKQVAWAAGALGLPQSAVPRRGYATLVADGNGIGLYSGGSTPTLLLGIPRSALVSVASGDAKAVGRYAFGRVDAIRVLAGDPNAPVSFDVPAYRVVLGFPKHLRGEELHQVVRTVASAVGVSVATQPPLR